MNIENILSELESKLRALGFSEKNSALLIQVNIAGQNYIRSCGNLNNLMGTAMTLNKNTDYDFIDFMESEINNASISMSTRVLHCNTVKLLREYNFSIDIQNITTAYLYDLDSFMRNRGLAINTIARHMKVLKKYVNLAIKKELLDKYPFFGYSIRSEFTHKEFLTEKELGLLENYEPKSSEEEEVLLAFLFSCYTGLRYSDICKFTKHDICSLNRKQWIVTRMKKTNSEARIPLSSIFEGKGLQICKSIKRSRGLLFHIKNNQQANRLLKKITKRVGIKKNITFHAGRHTCATLLLYRGVNITTVQKILGHQSVKTTQIYSAITDLTIEKDIKKSNKGYARN